MAYNLAAGLRASWPHRAHGLFVYVIDTRRALHAGLRPGVGRVWGVGVFPHFLAMGYVHCVRSMGDKL